MDAGYRATLGVIAEGCGEKKKSINCRPSPKPNTIKLKTANPSSLREKIGMRVSNKSFAVFIPANLLLLGKGMLP